MKEERYDDKTLKIAVKKWVEFENDGNPEAAFGSIADWDVLDVTSMEGLFEGQRTSMRT